MQAVNAQSLTTELRLPYALRNLRGAHDATSKGLLFKSPEESVLYISQKIDEIKILSRKKKITGNLNEYNTCHSCNNLIEKVLMICCTEPECSRYFCFRCLNKKFNKTPKTIYESVIASNWSCLSCQDACSCRKCKGRFVAKRELFPSEIALHEKTKRKQRTLSDKGEAHTENTLELAKAQSITDSSTSQTNNLILPAPIFHLELIPEVSSTQAPPSPLSVPSYHTSKPRTRDLAKLFKRQQRSDNSETGVSSVDQDEEQSIPETPETNMDVEEPKVEQSAVKSYNTRGSRSVVQQCHICQNSVSKASVATCSVQNCQKHYCIECIRKFQQKNFDLRWNYNPSYFMCFSCEGVCECQKCKNRKDTGKKKAKETQNEDESTVNNQENQKESQLLVKRRVKYYDTISEDEEEQGQRFHENRKQIKVDKERAVIVQEEKKTETENCIKESSQGIKACVDVANNRYLMKKMKFKAAAQLSSKIISQTSIDYACITLYDAETEDDIRK